MPDPIPAAPDTTGDVLLVLPSEAVVVAAGTPHVVWTHDYRRALAVPAGAYLDGTATTSIVVVHMSPVEALRLAAGHDVTLRIADGRTAQARIPTVAEVLKQYEQAVADAATSGAPVTATMSSADAERLIMPVDLAEVTAELLHTGAMGTTPAERAACLLRLAGYPTEPLDAVSAAITGDLS